MGDKIVCPQCGEKNKEKNNYCAKCGAPLRAGKSGTPPSDESGAHRRGPARRVARRAARRTVRRVRRR
ncbi:MAG: zinc-ribbon domain-containing protein [Promethearchaeota archaeon]